MRKSSIYCVRGTPLCTGKKSGKPIASLQSDQLCRGGELLGRGEDVPDFKSLSVSGPSRLPAGKETRAVRAFRELRSSLKTPDCKAESCTAYHGGHLNCKLNQLKLNPMEESLAQPHWLHDARSRATWGWGSPLWATQAGN